MSAPLPDGTAEERDDGRAPTHGLGVGEDGQNPYGDPYRCGGVMPDLDAHAPQLRSMDLRRMNRRALGFLAVTVLLLIALAFLLLGSTSGSRTPPKARPETVHVPALPQPPQPQPPVPRSPATPPTAVAFQATRPPALPVIPTRAPVPVLPALAPAQPAPSLLERRMMADDAGFPGMHAGAGGELPAPSGRSPGQRGSGAASARVLADPDTLLLRGTLVRCVLETRLISDIPGFTSCVVTEPVYSFDGRHLLVPRGSKVFGEYNHGPVGSRIAVVWDRIVTPVGIDVNMSSPGVDHLGGAGLPGHLDSHWPSRIGAALLISLMSDAFLYEGQKHGPRTDNISPAGGFVVQTPFQSNTAQTLQNLANQSVQQSANRKATLTINQGSVIAIYVTRDVDFSGVVARN